MSFDPPHSALAAAIDRATTAAPHGAKQITVELAISPDGRVAPSPKMGKRHTPYVGTKMTLRGVDPLEPLRKLLTEG